MIVTLTARETFEALETAVARQRWAFERNAKMFGRDSDNPARDHVLGCLGEKAVANVLGVPWDRTIGRLDIPDVGGLVDVRARRVPGKGTELIVYPKDHDDRPFVLVLVRVDWLIDVIGWLFAHEGKQRGRWFAPSGIYFVPPPYRSVDSLIELHRREVQWRTTTTRKTVAACGT